jgi:hypothetical protein
MCAFAPGYKEADLSPRVAFDLFADCADFSSFIRPPPPAIPLDLPTFRKLSYSLESAIATDDFRSINSLLVAIRDFAPHAGHPGIVALIRETSLISNLAPFIPLADDEEEDSDQSTLEFALELLAACARVPLLAREIYASGIPFSIAASFQCYSDTGQSFAFDFFLSLVAVDLPIPLLGAIAELSLREMANPAGDAKAGDLAASLTEITRLSEDELEDAAIHGELLAAFLATLAMPRFHLHASSLRGLFCLICQNNALLCENREIFESTINAIEKGHDSRIVFYAIHVARLYYEKCDDVEVQLCVQQEIGGRLTTLWARAIDPAFSELTKATVIKFLAEVCWCAPGTVGALIRLGVFTTAHEVIGEEGFHVKAALCVLLAVGLAVGDLESRVWLAQTELMDDLVNLVDQIAKVEMVEMMLKGILAAVRECPECRLAFIRGNAALVFAGMALAVESVSVIVQEILRELGE